MDREIAHYTSKPPVKYRYVEPDPSSTYRLFDGSDFATAIDDVRWKSNVKKDVIFNNPYITASGTPYHVFALFKSRTNMDMLKIQMDQTLTVAVIFYNTFTKADYHQINIIDPNALTMFNNNGAVGNIEYKSLGDYQYSKMKNGVRMYYIWLDYMRRLYDPCYPLYQYYGGKNVKILYKEWRIFRFFYKFFDTKYHDDPIALPDLNNAAMYSYPPGLTQMPSAVPQQMDLISNQPIIPNPSLGLRGIITEDNRFLKYRFNQSEKCRLYRVVRPELEV